jgi:DNA polymerase-1
MANEILNDFYKCFPGIQDFKNYVWTNCQSKGYVETIAGRLRYLPDINSTQSNLAATARRQAVNTTIQVFNLEIYF